LTFWAFFVEINQSSKCVDVAGLYYESSVSVHVFVMARLWIVHEIDKPNRFQY